MNVELKKNPPKMFDEQSFKVFEIDGLDARMTAIRAEIQPIFQACGEEFLSVPIAKYPTQDFFLHIAQHRRRTANAPENTWSAISTKPRGYKMEAHFQLGIWGDYVFMYLSMIDQPKDQTKYAEALKNVELPQSFVVSKDHTKAEFFPNTEFSAARERFGKVKKAELEFGRIWEKSRFDGQQNEKIWSEMLETLDQLLPIYEKLMKE